MYFFKNDSNNWIIGDSVYSLASKTYSSLIIHSDETVSLAYNLSEPSLTIEILKTYKNESNELYESFSEFINVAYDYFID